MPGPALLEHQQLPSNYGLDVEDIFNMDLFNTASSSSAFAPNMAASAPTLPSGAASTSSRSSSRSPSESFSNLPSTPSQPMATNSFDFGNIFNTSTLAPLGEESMFTFNFDGVNDSEFFKAGVNPMATLTGAPYELFGGAFASDFSAPATAGASTSTSTSSSTSPSQARAIDPQLVGTPASSSHDADSDEEKESKDEDEDDEEDEPILIPIKVGGKGKARKGTLQSGGVQKKSAGPQSIFGSLADKPMSIADKLKDKDDDWRPSPEEYQKMTSKEKRQLRNKISARNFRVRRKEYIQTLEGDIAERDHIIDAIRAELGNTKSENNALRQEVASLKKAIMEGRASPMLPPPAPLSPLSPLTSFASLQQSSSSSSSNNIVRPNTQKDLPTSPRLAAIRGAGAFWGGQANSFGGLGGGITPVHTTLIPETGFGNTGKNNVGSNTDRSNENMNPTLNQTPVPITVTSNKVFSAGHGANQQFQESQQTAAQQLHQQNLLMGHVLSQLQSTHGFDAFTDVNPFTLKTLDAYRMQLWSRMAMQQRPRVGQQQFGYPSPSSSNTSPANSPSPAPGSPSLSGLATGLRPLHFSSPPSTSSTPTGSGSSKLPLSSLLSGKSLYHHPHGLPTPPSSPRMGAADRNTANMQRERENVQQHAQHALLASLASQTILQKMSSAFWDAFSGSSTGSSGQKAWDSEKVRKIMEGTAVLRVVDVEPTKRTSSPAALEESMRSLSLSPASSSASSSKDEKKGLFSRLPCSPCRKPSSQ